MISGKRAINEIKMGYRKNVYLGGFPCTARQWKHTVLFVVYLVDKIRWEKKKKKTQSVYMVCVRMITFSQRQVVFFMVENVQILPLENAKQLVLLSCWNSCKPFRL
ncbi:hypothetical protein LWI29_021565 [Acer saccharum]|uniref:Uncharacterized protein n=1 Tax=Acer saccharum TaxID=4024 RepID=A0AA39W2V2_ACESA|nr:hypothetical protein LWI29_021565 [Acer saccharum]